MGLGGTTLNWIGHLNKRVSLRGTVSNHECTVLEYGHGEHPVQVSDIEADVVKRVIGSLGFSSDRVERAVECLLDGAKHGPSESRQVLSFDDVRRMLAVSRSTLRRMMAAGQLKPVQITTRRIGFLSSDVDAFIMALPLKTTPLKAGQPSTNSTVTAPVN